MSEEQKLNPNYNNAIFLKDDGSEMKFRKIYKNNKKGEKIEYVYEYIYDKEKQNIRSKKFYEINKEKIIEKISCDVCKKLISKANFDKHKITKKHLINIELKKITDILDITE